MGWGWVWSSPSCCAAGRRLDEVRIGVVIFVLLPLSPRICVTLFLACLLAGCRSGVGVGGAVRVCGCGRCPVLLLRLLLWGSSVKHGVGLTVVVAVVLLKCGWPFACLLPEQ